MSASQSRLDKLLALLEDGKTSSIRTAAAHQIVGLTKAHPGLLGPVIAKVHLITRHKKWEARVAAGVCFRLLAEHMQHFKPSDLETKAGGRPAGVTTAGKESSKPSQGMALQNFKLDQVLQFGKVLLQSGGEEYDLDLGGETASERLKKQRQALKKRLGMGGEMGDIMETEDLVGDQDLVVEAKRAKPQPEKHSASQLLDNMEGLSARERNQLKRKMKQGAKGGQAPAVKKAKTNPVQNKESQIAVEGAQEVTDGRWPFQGVADQLVVDCLHPAWETRHGAALALREILTCQAASAAVVGLVDDTPTGWAAVGGHGTMQLRPCSAEEAASAAAANAVWLEECVIHLLCVLALDRFGDYVSDQVTAPVRETAAQALGAVARVLSRGQASSVLGHLGQLTKSSEWCVRHGGFLGIKCLLAAWGESLGEMLPTALPLAIAGLQDGEDDIRAVAADALLPASAAVVSSHGSALAQLKRILWDTLLTLEDLSLSTGSVMLLLTSIYDNMPAGVGAEEALGDMVPRLFPFFRHTLTSVRLATLRCLTSLLLRSGTPTPWLQPAELLPALHLTFQNLVTEADAKVVEASKVLWRQLIQQADPAALLQAASPAVIDNFFDLASTMPQAAIAQAKLFRAALPGQTPRDASGWANFESLESAEGATRMRFNAAEALGLMACHWPAGSQCQVARGVLAHITSQAASSRLLATLTVKAWVKEADARGGHFEDAEICKQLVETLKRPKADRGPGGRLQSYPELAALYSQAHNATLRLLKLCKAGGVDMQALLSGMQPEQYVTMLTADNAKEVLALMDVGQDPGLLDAKAIMAATVETLLQAENRLHSTVTATAAAATIHAGQLPSKLNLVIQPIMATLRRETDPLLRSTAAVALAELVSQCAQRTPSPNGKIIGNVAALVCGDPAETPDANLPDPVEEPPESSKLGGKKAKGPSEADLAAQSAAEAAAVARQGGEAALQAVVRRSGPHLPSAAPKIMELINSGLTNQSSAGALDAGPAMASLQTLRVAGPVMPPQLEEHLLRWLHLLAQHCLPHTRSIVRDLAAKCAAAQAESRPDTLMPHILRLVVPLLSTSQAAEARQGGVQLVFHLVRQLQEAIVPYLFLLVVPTMACMSDPIPSLRLAATSSFASMVALLPLAQGMDPPAALDAEQVQKWHQDAEFLEQLMDNSQGKPFTAPIKINGELRPYQQDGINWLAFLRRCGLHGVLADDMGLGKTLQATAIVAASHLEASSTGQRSAPSLVVCPQVLVGHWAFEIEKFVGRDTLVAMAYEGAPNRRHELRKALHATDVVAMSYETLRSDADWVHSISWNYCILDEGHIIRNPRSKINQAVKGVVAQNRLILSGTPIQNNIQELWALFDFLMPGFLGSEAAFNAQFGKALKSGRASKTGSSEAQAGLLAMEGLHKQVKPFILRRTKDSVLKDLPPKILQDVFCNLSPLQAALYDHMSASTSGDLASIADGKSLQDSAQTAPHVFQALQYLRKLCSHPLMVLQPSLPVHMAACTEATNTQTWEAAQGALHASLEHAPKLLALHQLLQQCGIGVKAEEGAGEDPGVEGASLLAQDSSHRVLVFAQFKGLLDLVEADVIAPMGISYLRLDGSVEASQRFGIVQRFNQDPSIPVMLLTTSVGGLGLNLTAADTVIFLEHDWNPMKDLQAMDRAHRLGQKRTVHVYRLLMKDSLEERIMSLQRFKVDVANAVINQDNVSLSSMGTNTLLDILNRPSNNNSTSAVVGKSEDAAEQVAMSGKAGGKKSSGLKSVMEGLEEMWDDSHYAEEFSLDTFVKKLK